MQLNIADTFNKELPADTDRRNTRRQVHGACFSYVTPREPSAAKLLHVSPEMATAIGLTPADLAQPDFLETFSGGRVLAGTEPYAMCYGGHQFGHWAGQLGDGRAINLAEVVHEGQRWALQLKGAGATPYSRTADGLAVLRSSVREHLCSEAMFHLGVPTTRSLSLCLTGDPVMRDMLYDGNPAYEKGAVVCRVSPSFIRFGNFQIFASRKDLDNLKLLTEYTMRTFFPEITATGPEGYLAFFKAVLNRTRRMIVEWQRVGFVHGVMNTDNLSILGLTIDYGPYGWLEGYEKDWTPNTTDAQNRRYRFGNQPMVALWNLYQLANALVPLVGDPAPFQEILDAYAEDFATEYLDMMRGKLGLERREKADADLVHALEKVLELTETDMTLFFRLLGNVRKGAAPAAMLDSLAEAFYQEDELQGTRREAWLGWLESYRERLSTEPREDAARRTAMNQVNPKYVLRNYMAQLAIDAADQGDYSLIEELYELLRAPYAEQPEHEKWFARRPEWARHKVGCSMLSCSS